MINANRTGCARPRPKFASLLNVLAAIEPRIDKAFVDGDCYDRICKIAEHFPEDASKFFGFERRLGHGDARVDFALGISERGAGWLRSESPWPEAAKIFDKCLEHAAAGAIRPWLEFDTSLVADAKVEPSVYIGVNPREIDTASMLALAQKLTLGTSRSLGSIARCLDLLPGSVYCVYMGKMRGRCIDGTRLSVASLGREQLTAYLRRVEWPGNLDAVNAFLLRFRSVSNRFGVQLDVGPDVTPNLGLELIAEGPMLSERAASYNTRLLHLLVKEGMCSAGESEKLASWPSESTTSTPFIDMLLASARANYSENSVARSLVTILHHVKFAFRTDGPVQTKAYFGVALE